MYQIEVLTPWVGTGADDDANWPKIGDDYALAKWEDITGTPSASLQPSPNLNIIRAECEEAVLLSIEADGVYWVLTAEEIMEEAVQ